MRPSQSAQARKQAATIPPAAGCKEPAGEFPAGSVTRCRAPVKKGFSAKGYFSDELIVEKFVFRVEPRPLTAAMIASAMPAAIRPYSIAVAPD